MPGLGQFGVSRKQPKPLGANHSFKRVILFRKYEPTYKMEPDTKPNVADLKLILKETVQQCSEKINWQEFHKTKALLRLNNLLHRKLKSKI
jgi:hypothetical protein